MALSRIHFGGFAELSGRLVWIGLIEKYDLLYRFVMMTQGLFSVRAFLLILFMIHSHIDSRVARECDSKSFRKYNICSSALLWDHLQRSILYFCICFSCCPPLRFTHFCSLYKYYMYFQVFDSFASFRRTCVRRVVF